TLAPAIGLPPELPGGGAGPLVARQLWWLMTVLSTGAALAFAVFGRRTVYIAIAVVLLAFPHLVGAPAPEGEAAVPAALVQRFAVVWTVPSLLFWLVLGPATGHFYRRFSPRAG